MGQSATKDGSGYTELMEKHEKEYRIRKRNCERKTVGFMESVGKLQASAEQFARFIMKDYDEQNDEHSEQETELSAKYFLFTSKDVLDGQKSDFIEELAGFIDFISEYTETKRLPNTKDESSMCNKLRNCIKESIPMKGISQAARQELTIITDLKGEISNKEKEIEKNRKLLEEKSSFENKIRKPDDEVALEAKIYTTKMKELQDKIQEHVDKNETVSERLKLSKRRVAKLQRELAQKKSDITDLSENYNKQFEEMTDIHSKEMRKKSEEHKKNLNELSDISDNVVAQLTDNHTMTMTQINIEHKEKLDQMYDDHRRESRIQEKQHEDYSNKLERQIQKFKDQLHEKTDSKDRISELLSIERGEMLKLNKENLTLNDRLQSAENTIRDLREKISGSEEKYTSDISELNSNLQATTGECDHLQAELRSETSALATVLAQLQYLRRKSIIKVKLFCHRRVNIVSDFENDLMAQLKSKVETEHKELVFEQLTDPKDAQDDSDTDPTIVLCLTTSSIEMDANNGVQGLHLSSKKALLIIHHKEKHALPQQSSERVLTGQKFKDLGCILDMAFLSEKGIFKCEHNTNSVLKLVSFIRKEGVEHRKY